MRKTCLACGAPLWKEPLMICDHMPKSAQHFPAAEEVSSDQTVTLRLMECSGCGLVQLDTDAVGYYRDVIRSGGYSTTMHQLRHEQYERFLSQCPLEGKKIIEVGCGRGEFLRIWREDHFPVEAFGIEHDPELVKITAEDHLSVEQNFAEDEESVFTGGPFDGFCSFNFLEHQPYPGRMLRSIYSNLRDEAYGLITVPAWEYILEQESYYELIRDHIAYYSKESFTLLLENNGFRVLSTRLVNRDTWEAIVAKKQRVSVDAMIQNREILKQEIRKLTDSLRGKDGKLAVWGASHQGLTILSSMELEQDIAYVIDSAPFKQGLYTIGSHIRIVSPDHVKEEPVQAILIIAPGYTEEIAYSVREEYGDKITIYALRGNHLEKIPQ